MTDSTLGIPRICGNDLRSMFKAVHLQLRTAVGFPRLPTVGRKRLFPAAGIWAVHGPDEAVEDMPAFEYFLREKLAARTIELAYHWHVQRPRAAARHPIDAPLPRGRIVETDRHGLNTA